MHRYKASLEYLPRDPPPFPKPFGKWWPRSHECDRGSTEPRQYWCFIVKFPDQMVRTREEYVKRPDCQISTLEQPPGHFEKTYLYDWFFLFRRTLLDFKMTNNKNDSKVTHSHFWPSNPTGLPLYCYWPHVCTSMWRRSYIFSTLAFLFIETHGFFSVDLNRAILKNTSKKKL